VAAEGFTKPWSMRREMLSPRYTTRWNELPLVKL
jgi:DNA polymerase V